MNPALEYIDNQSEFYRNILIHLQVIIEHTVPSLSLKYKYKIPFYYLNDKPFCYLNATKGYVDVGFWKGNSIMVYQEHLVTEGRKLIKSLRYSNVEEIQDEVLIEILKFTAQLYEK